MRFWRLYAVCLACAALLLAAWTLARLIPVREPVPAAYERILTELDTSTPPAEFCARVNQAFHIMLTYEDVANFRRLATTQTTPAEALRIVLLYRQASLQGRR